MFSFFQAKPPYSVEKISEGKFLDKAKEVDVEFFFQHWMRKKIKKTFVGTWLIFNEDEEFVYWGWPQFKRIFSDKRIAIEFYKTNKIKLNQSYPDYKSKDGNIIRMKLHKYIQNSLPKKTYVTVSIGFKAQLLESTIVTETNCGITPHSTEEIPNPIAEQAIYKVVLDKNTLDLIELKKINK